MRPPPRPASASGEIWPKVMLVFLTLLLAFMALDSFPLATGRVLLSSVVVGDADRLDDPLRLRSCQVDRQQSALQIRTQNLHSVGEHEGALELARRNAAMEILAGLVVLLAPANDKLAFLQRHVELIARETGNRQRDAQALRLAVLPGDPFDVVGRVAVRSLGNAVERTLDFIEAKKERAGQRRNS